MPLFQNRTLQLLMISYGFSIMAMGGLRPLFGHGWHVTAVSLLLTAAISYLALRTEGWSLSALGGSPANLGRAVVLTALLAGLTYILLPAVVPGLAPSGPMGWQLAEQMLLRGLAEELLLRGILLTGLVRLLDPQGVPWGAVTVDALLSALFHLPTALWMGGPAWEIAGRVLWPMLGALFLFGPLYLVSRNLWLVALVHALSLSHFARYLREEALGPLLFAATALLLGRYLLRPMSPLPLLSRGRAAPTRPAQPAPRRIGSAL